MAGVAPRLWYDNLVQRAATLLAVSSELSSMPRGRLLFPLRSDAWRSAGPWVIVTGVNDRIDFDRAGVKVATIAAGIYTTAASLCEAIRVAMEAADSTPVWASNYSSGTTFKFTINTSSETFILKFSSGANKDRSVAIDIGFAETDTGSANTQTGGLASYQSRHWVHVDLGATLAFTVAAVINHNLSTGGTIRIDGHTATMVAMGLQSTTPGFTQVLAGDATMRQAYFASQSKQFARFVISDVQNPVGFAELGIAFVGTYLDLRGFATDVSDTSEPLSESTFAVQGADFHTKRQKRRGWMVAFRSRTAAEKVLLQAVEDLVGAGGHVFFDFDSAASQIRYVILPGLDFKSIETDPPTWDLDMPLRESLG